MSEYSFNFTEQEINYILNVLSKQPYIEVAGVIDKTQKQASAQENAN